MNNKIIYKIQTFFFSTNIYFQIIILYIFFSKKEIKFLIEKMKTKQKKPLNSYHIHKKNFQ